MGKMIITESKLNEVIIDEIMSVLEGAGWNAFKQTAKSGWDSGDEDDIEINSKNIKKVIKGEPNQNDYDYHNIMAKNARDKESKERHSMGATIAEPGIKGKLKRGAAIAGGLAGYAAKKAKNSLSKNSKNTASKKEKTNKKK